MPDESSLNSARLTGVVATLVVIVALYFGKSIFLPIVASILICFILSSFASWLERRGVGRLLSVIVIVAVVFGFFSGVGWLIFSQLIDLSEKIPSYRVNLVKRIHQIEELVPMPFARASETIRNIGQELADDQDQAAKTGTSASKGSGESQRIGGRQQDAATPWDVFSETPGETAGQPPSPASDEPVKVDVVSLPPSPLQAMAGWFGPLVSPLGSVTMVIVLTIFMLLEREDFRNRLVQLLASSNLAIATTAIADATQKTSIWLRMMCLINAIYAIVIGFALFLIGLPNPLVWGVFAFFFRFVPYLGAWISATLPILVSFAVFEGWFQPLAVVLVYVAMDLIVNTILEPWLYGKPVGLTSMGVILAVMFWTWLWGPVGILVAVPISLWLVVLGRYVPQMNSFAMLLGDLSDMPSYHTLYQRLLAFDRYESMSILRQQLSQRHRLSETFDQILLPLLQRAQIDYRARFISNEQMEFIDETIEDVLDEWSSDAKAPANQGEGSNTMARSILVQPLHTRSDEIAARILTIELSRLNRLSVAVGSVSLLSNDLLARIADQHIDTVVISAIQPLNHRKFDLLAKKLQSQLPSLRLIPVFWQARPGLPPNSKEDDGQILQTMSQVIACIENNSIRGRHYVLDTDSQSANLVA